MTSGFVNGATPLAFVGRRSARIAHWVMVAFFLAFWIPTVGFAIVERSQPYAIFVGVVGGVLWSAMIFMCMQNVFAASSTIKVEPDGLTIQTPLGVRIIKWSDVSRVTEADHSTSTVKLYLTSGGSVPLRLSLIEDGKELGRIVQRNVTPPSASTESGVRTFRFANRSLYLLLIGVGSTFYVGGGLFEIIVTTGRKQGTGYMLLVLGLLWTALVARRLESFATVDDTAITFGDRFKKRTVPLTAIQRVDSGNRADKPIRIYTDDANWPLPTSLEAPDELLARLQAAIGGVEQTSEAAPQKPAVENVPAQDGQPVEFKVKRSFFGQAAFLLAMAVFLTSLGPITIIQEPRSLILGLLCTALFGSMLLATAYATLYSSATYVADDTALERKGRLKPWRVPFADMETAWRRGQNLSTLRIVVRGKPTDIDLQPLQDGDALVALVLTRVPDSKSSIGPKRFGPGKSPNGLVGIGLFFMIGGWATRQASLAMMFTAIGAPLALLGYSMARKVLETTADGIWSIGWTKRRFVRFADIKRMEIDTMSTKSGSIRKITLEHPEGGLMITSTVDDFAILEAYLRDRLGPNKVNDSTETHDFIAKPGASQ